MPGNRWTALGTQKQKQNHLKILCLTYQSYVDLPLHELPARVIRLVKLPVVVELYCVSVALRWKLFHHIIHILVLRGGRTRLT